MTTPSRVPWSLPLKAILSLWLTVLLSGASALRRGGSEGVFCSHHQESFQSPSTTTSLVPFPSIHGTNRQATTIHSRRTLYLSTTKEIKSIQLCSSPAAVTSRSIPATLARGAFLRILSDMSGGTVFENIKCRVTVSKDTALQAVDHIYRNSGIRGFWTGAPSRTVEGALVGAVFMLSSTITKTQIKALGASPTVAAMTAGLVGGVAQALIMTPAGMVFTNLNVHRGSPGHERDTAFSVVNNIVRENGPLGLYHGFKPMALRQATNWATRTGFTEVARSALGLQKYGILGEIASGVMGGLVSCVNTPIETLRVITQRDISIGAPVLTMGEYWNKIVREDGYLGLYRGVTPRSLQAIWQTCFMVVVPNIMGI